MLKYGALAQTMRPMDKDDIFFARLNLLVVMAKALLKDYPLGPFRARALEENARFVFYEALKRSDPAAAASPEIDSGHSDDQFSNLFLQRAQLLAVMCKSIVEGNPLGDYRKKAMSDNIDRLCQSMTDTIPLGEIRFLKVA